MRKSRSEETSRLLDKEEVDSPRSVHEVLFKGDDGSPAGVYPTPSRYSKGSAKSLIVVLNGDDPASSKEEETQTLLNNVPGSIPSANHSVLGISLTFVCAIALSCAAFLAKYLILHGIPAANCIFWRGPLVLVISSVWLMQLVFCTDIAPVREALWPPSRKERTKTLSIMFLSRVIIGPASVATQFFSLAYIELGDSNTIVYSAAVFVPVFAYCFLHEAWGVVPFLAAILTAIGVMIISKPAFIVKPDHKATDHDSTARVIGFCLALTAMFLNVGVYITVRYLHHLPAVILVWLMSLFSTLLGLILSLAMGGLKAPTALDDIFAVLGLMTTTAIGQFSLVWALRYEEAGMVSLIRCSELVFGFLWQMILEVYPDAFSIGGASLVLCSFGLVFFRKYLQHLPPEHRFRRRLKYLLM